MLYIGETCRQINNRFGEHLRNVEHKIHENEERADNADSNVSRHFNLPGHSKTDMAILWFDYGAKLQQTEKNT